MKTEFSDDDYKFSHGKNPRGSGYWCFDATGSDGQGSWTEIGKYFELGTFSRARSAAKRRAVSDARCISGVVLIVLSTQA